MRLLRTPGGPAFGGWVSLVLSRREARQFFPSSGDHRASTVGAQPRGGRQDIFAELVLRHGCGECTSGRLPVAVLEDDWARYSGTAAVTLTGNPYGKAPGRIFSVTRACRKYRRVLINQPPATPTIYGPLSICVCRELSDGARATLALEADSDRGGSALVVLLLRLISPRSACSTHGVRSWCRDDIHRASGCAGARDHRGNARAEVERHAARFAAWRSPLRFSRCCSRHFLVRLRGNTVCSRQRTTIAIYLPFWLRGIRRISGLRAMGATGSSTTLAAMRMPSKVAMSRV